jgi:rsbT antagonist protein RsbS
VENRPGPVSIMRQGPYLIASIHTALDDAELVEFQRDLLDRIGVHGSGGVVIESPAWM